MSFISLATLMARALSRLGVMSVFGGILSAAMVAEATAQTTDQQAANTGSIDVGGLHDKLSSPYPAWSGEFIRGVFHPDDANTVNFEANELKEFGARGSLFVLGDTAMIHDVWIVAVNAQASSDGFFLPKERVDVDVQRKWLTDGRLITGIGALESNARDGVHRDRAGKAQMAYYFESPWVLEAGGVVNKSSPGNVRAASGFVAVTQGRDKTHYVSVRLGAGREAYQITGVQTALVNFPSHVVTATWRQWVVDRGGVQVRAEAYGNPSYRRNGVEAGIFFDF